MAVTVEMSQTVAPVKTLRDSELLFDVYLE